MCFCIYKKFVSTQASILLSEPYFYTSILPWHNIFYWYARTDLSALLIDNPKVN